MSSTGPLSSCRTRNEASSPGRRHLERPRRPAGGILTSHFARLSRLSSFAVFVFLGACGPDTNRANTDAQVTDAEVDGGTDASDGGSDAGHDAGGDAGDDALDGGNDAHAWDCTDGDGDGYGVGVDCLGPDCDDGVGSAHAMLVHYVDGDGDGAGAGSASMICAASPPAGSSASSNDCDDTNPWIAPTLPEIPDNGADDDCDGVTVDAATPPPNATYVANVAGCVMSGVGTKTTPICKLDAAIYSYESLTTVDPTTYPSPFIVFLGGPTQTITTNIELAATTHLASIHGGYDASTWTRVSPIVPTAIQCVDPISGTWGAYGCLVSAKGLTLSGLDIRGPSNPTTTTMGEVVGLVLDGQGTTHLRDVTLRGGDLLGAGRYGFGLRATSLHDVLARDVRILGGSSWCGAGADVSSRLICVDCDVTPPYSPLCPAGAKGLSILGSVTLVNSTVHGTSAGSTNGVVVGAYVDSGGTFVAIDSVIVMTNAHDLTGVQATRPGGSATLVDSIVAAEASTSCSSNCDSVAIRASMPVVIDHSIVYSGYASGAAYENPSATYTVGGAIYRVALVTGLATCASDAQAGGALTCPTMTSAYDYDASLAFVDAPNGNFRLAPASYGVGLGSTPAPTLYGQIYSFVDVDGVSRPQGAARDVGVNEQ